MEDKIRVLQMIFEFVATIVAMGCATGVIAAFLKYRGRKGIQSPDVLVRLDEISERLARLDTAVDSMAIEVERISEAQRFTSKLLAERAGTPALPERVRGGGSTTPH